MNTQTKKWLEQLTEISAEAAKVLEQMQPGQVPSEVHHLLGYILSATVLIEMVKTNNQHD